MSDLTERVAIVLLATILVAISYWLDFRHLIVIASSTDTTYESYEMLIVAWAWSSVAFAVFHRTMPIYLVLSAAVIAHAYSWLILEAYFGAVSMEKTFGAVTAIAIVNGILLARRADWKLTAAFNAIVAAAVFPLVMQQTIAMTAPVSR